MKFVAYLTLQCGDLGRQATRFKEQCDALKTQRDTLGSELAKLREERSQLVSERDTLRLEYQSEAQLNEWFLQRDLSAANAPDLLLELASLGASARSSASDPSWRDEKGRACAPAASLQDEMRRPRARTRNLAAGS